MSLEPGAAGQLRSVRVTREVARIPDDRAIEFHERLAALTEEFLAAGKEYESSDEKLQNYALMIAFYPSFFFPEEGENEM